MAKKAVTNLGGDDIDIEYYELFTIRMGDKMTIYHVFTYADGSDNAVTGSDFLGDVFKFKDI